MNFPEKEIVSGPRSFVTEKDIEERRRQKQEEWERTRKPDDPLEAPEEVYDHRTLYEKLQEQKMKKEADYEEAHKLKNMIRGLDDDEAGFLDYIDRARMESEERKKEEEESAIAEFKKTISDFTNEEKEKKIQEFKKSLWSASRIEERKKMNDNFPGCKRSAQAALLAGAVKRKADVLESSSSSKEPSKEHPLEKKPSARSDPKSFDASGETIRCIGILPGIGVYGSDSSDSENSTDSEIGACDDLEPTLISRVQRTSHDSKKQ